MPRVVVLLVIALAFSPPAAAYPSAKTEHGVRVWRAAAPPAAVASTLDDRSGPCARRAVVIVIDDWRGRRLRTHRWSGDGLAWETRLPLTTQGFFADRMAAGL